MEIQRQSDYYSLDLPEVHQASLTADQIRDMTSGPSIPTGMLNTRIAWREGQPWTYAPENIFPDDSGEGTDEEDDDPDAEEEPKGYELEDRLKKRDRYISEDDIHHGSVREANPAALMRLLPLLEMGGGGGGVLDQALGDVSGAESKAAFDRAAEEY